MKELKGIVINASHPDAMKIQRKKKGNIRMKNIKTHKSLASAKRHMAAVMIGKAGG